MRLSCGEEDRWTNLSSSSPVLLEMYDHVKVTEQSTARASQFNSSEILGSSRGRQRK